MKKLVHLTGLLFCLVVAACTSGGEPTASYEQVIPQPHAIRPAPEAGGFRLGPSTVVAYPQDNEKMKKNALFLSDYIRTCTGLDLPTQAGAGPDGCIRLVCDPAASTSPEGYRLTVNQTGVTIAAPTEAGVFYGIQTLRKSLPLGKTAHVWLPAVEVEDSPQFTFRGLHLDVGRHYFPIDFIKKYIDLLALHNFNVFHWHLTEDQGWRIEIKKYPRLTTIGSQRRASMLNDGSGKDDGTPYGGFYTQEEAREIIRYAAERHVTVIPEIDLPGHIQSALAAYPELGCTGGPYEVAVEYGVLKDVLCVGNPQSLQFAKDVLEEIIGLFPSHYIHVGGDECPRDRWSKCPKCQQLIRQKGWSNTAHYKKEDKLQSYFMTEVEKFVNSKGRQIIGWDEILEGGLAPNATVMSWRGTENGITAARQGHDVIMTPMGYTYLSNGQLMNLGGNRSIKRIYDFEVIPDSLPDEVARHILGVEACLWSERIPTPERAEYMVLPRLAAISELAWSDPAQRDFGTFMERLYPMTRLYDTLGYQYADHVFQITESFRQATDKPALEVSLSTIGHRPIYYTTDGSEPSVQSDIYTTPLQISESTRLQARVIAPNDTSELFAEDIRVNKATFKPCQLAKAPHRSYTFAGAATLTDGLNGSTNYNTGRWLGFLCDMDLTIDLLQPTTFSSVTATTDVAISSAVMGATGMEVWVSDDGKDFNRIATASYPILDKTAKDGIYPHTLTFDPTTARYVRVVLKATPQLPAWHTWPGGAAFLFVDEICVE